MSAGTLTTSTKEGLPHIQATLNYLVEPTEKPVAYAYMPPPGTPQTTRRNDPRTVTISDARLLLDQLSLDTQGFVLTHHASKVVNFYNETEVREVYYPEVEQLLKKVTGAVKVVIFDHVVRCATKAKPGENAVREPAKLSIMITHLSRPHNACARTSPKRRKRCFNIVSRKLTCGGRLARNQIRNRHWLCATPVASHPRISCRLT